MIKQIKLVIIWQENLCNQKISLVRVKDCLQNFRMTINQLINILLMQQELSDKTFESRLGYIKGNLLAYIDIKPSSPQVILVIHQHLGLSNYLRVIVQALSNNMASIVMPNLFGEINEESANSEDDAKFLSSLDHSIIMQIIFEIVEEIQSKGKKLILVGFSLGSAIGMKMLQFLQDIQFSMFFYGFPPLHSIDADKIKSKTILYVGSNDKVQHLSDSGTLKIAKKMYASNQLVEIIQVNGLSHGFMNPASKMFNQEKFKDCCSHFQALLKTSKKLYRKPSQSQPDAIKKSEPDPIKANGSQQNKSKSNDQNKQKQESSCQLI